MNGPRPRPPQPHATTTMLALQEAVGTWTTAMAAGEIDNPILGESIRLELIRLEALVRRELED